MTVKAHKMQQGLLFFINLSFFKVASPLFLSLSANIATIDLLLVKLHKRIDNLDGTRFATT